MKVAIDVAQTCRNRAGGGWHADSLARALAEELGKESVILYHHFGDWLNPDTRPGTEIEGVAEPFRAQTREEAREVWREIANGSPPPLAPDIVHSNSFMAPSVPTAKLVYTVHDLCFWTHPQFTSETNRSVCQKHLLLALQRACAFHFISETTRNDFENLLPGFLERSKKPHVVAQSGCRLEPPPPTASANPQKSPQSPWLFVGTIEPRKNVEALLDAYVEYAKRQDQPRPLHIIGGQGWESQATHNRISSLSRNNDIRYHGYVADERLKEHYRSAYALLCPSHYEGFGLPVIEAMSYGLPCIANSIPSIREFAEGSIELVDFSDIRSVCSAMLQLESEPERYSERRWQGLKTSSHFTWQRTASTLIDFYHQLI
ncbi:glycosyltransferase family 4 protein [Pelagicoccus sp. NFK12]|uniref:Glycosyltransferase family 4 protein n=1 Tax=Pelagicoccus enzymogenes TaxID=2773457 RepID=A0A927F9E1_9BACT|nr:glycosyltransferase family 1 protein [Pelagicoccus enzymogenes]MBD5780908.1 glycosyltransferase family 4 protein [Pelagicoccus enzymogenes]